MQTTRHLVGVLIELTACVKHGHDDLEGTLVKLLVLVDGNTATVIFHRATTIGVEGHLDVGAIARHSLVNTVVYRFVDEVMKTLL